MPDESPWVYIEYRCHMCSESGFQNVYVLRDHWQRDHNYNVTIRIVPDRPTKEEPAVSDDRIDCVGLQADLDELEATDPQVAHAAERLDAANRSIRAAHRKVAALPADQRAALEAEFQRAEQEAQQIMRNVPHENCMGCGTWVGPRCVHGRLPIDPCAFCFKELSAEEYELRARKVYIIHCHDCGLDYEYGNGHLTTDCIQRLKAQISERVELIERLRNPEPEPCTHDCATGIGTITTVSPEWSGTIWECTECHAIGEDNADNTAIVWADAEWDDGLVN